MEEKKIKKRGWFSIFSDSIQLRFYRTENFEEVGSINLSPRSIYIALTSTILVVLLLVFALLAYTPLQRLIPRLSSIENANKFIQLSDNIDDIESEINAQDVYLNAVQKMIVGDETVNLDEIEVIDIDPKTPKTNNATPIVDDSESNNSTSSPPKKKSKMRLNTGSIFDEMATVDFYSPLEGVVSADFDPQLDHIGVDIIAPADTPVKSIRSGHIIISEWNIETGHTIGVQHDNNILSFYKHNSILLKEKGNFVKAGEIIAIIGNSGRLTSGPHLHFEIWHNGKPVNPNDYINLKHE